jgi:hypothetical protein
MRQTTLPLSLSLSLSLSLLLSGTAFAADSQLMNLMMPDAKVVAGINATSAVHSPLGQFILSKIGQLPQGFITATGFNPFDDVSEVLAATSADPSNPGGLALARGTFPVDKITAALSGGSANWQATTYGGATLISTTNPKDKLAKAVAFIGSSIAVAGDLASVKAAIDRSSGSNSIDPALAVTVNQLSTSEDEWLVSSVSIGSLIPANASMGAATGPAAMLLPLFKSIQSFQGGVKLGDNVVVTGEAVANSPQNAAALNAVIKLGLTLGGAMASNAAKNPQLTEAIQLLQATQVTTNGSAVDVSLSIPEAQIETLVNSIPAPTKAVASIHQPSLPANN